MDIYLKKIDNDVCFVYYSVDDEKWRDAPRLRNKKK